MASDILVMNSRPYFDVKKFEHSIANKGIERQKRIAVRKKIKFLDSLLMIAVVMVFIMCLFLFVQIGFQELCIMKKENEITILENKLNKKVFENKEKQNDTCDTIKYEDLKMKAYMELNMIIPTEENIIYFNKSNSEYVRQYENIR